jgi:integrase/recombinase XerC
MATTSALADSFKRSQQARSLSPQTIRLYRVCINRLIAFAGDDPGALTRRTLTDYYATRLASVSPQTVSIDWRVIHVFIKWLVDEEELGSDPMARMHGPRQKITPIPILSDKELGALVRACEGRTLRDRRDMALVRLAIDSGCRRGELAGLTIENVDLDDRIAVVTGKGKTRTIPFGSKTALALDRWLRHRPSRVGDKGERSLFGLSASGVYQAFRERAIAAGVSTTRLHAIRHSYAHRWLRDGGAEGDLMRLAGWSSRSLLDRYGASAATARAIEAHRRIAPGDTIG